MGNYDILLEALQNENQRGAAMNPWMITGSAFNKMPMMQFSNPWATFGAAFGQNLLGGALTGYGAGQVAGQQARNFSGLAEALAASSPEEAKTKLEDAGLTNISPYLDIQRSINEAEQQNRLAELQQQLAIDLAKQKAAKELDLVYGPKIAAATEAARLGVNPTEGPNSKLAAWSEELRDKFLSEPSVKRADELAPLLSSMAEALPENTPGDKQTFFSALQRGLESKAAKDDPSLLGAFGKLLTKLMDEPFSQKTKQEIYQAVAREYKGTQDVIEKRIIPNYQDRAVARRLELRPNMFPTPIPTPAVQFGNSAGQVLADPLGIR